MNNPFTLSFGKKPLQYISRITQTTSWIRAVRRPCQKAEPSAAFIAAAIWNVSSNSCKYLLFIWAFGHPRKIVSSVPIVPISVNILFFIVYRAYAGSRLEQFF